MKLPDSSNALSVARFRFIQSIHESPGRRNPDSLVGKFIPLLYRWRTIRIRPAALARMRSDPFYYYLLARTRHYDNVVLEAVARGVKQIIVIGCGSDTRPYRFKKLLRANGIQVLECDLPEAIEAKRRIALRWRCRDFVTYVPIDLNDDSWPEFARAQRAGAAAPSLVYMEGVSPYINYTTFTTFLQFLAGRLRPGSQVAYDFKFRGINDAWGLSDRTLTPFRLPLAAEDVRRFHEGLGFRVESLALSTDLSAEVHPEPINEASRLFREDGLVRLSL